MSPLGGGATGLVALTEYGEATVPDRSVSDVAAPCSATIVLPQPCPVVATGVRIAREDPGSRRQVAARRPGATRPTVGRRALRRGGAWCGRALPRRRPDRRERRDQGPGPRRRPGQGRRREARELRGRGGTRRGRHP